jgi:hypothetical protein
MQDRAVHYAIIEASDNAPRGPYPICAEPEAERLPDRKQQNEHKDLIAARSQKCSHAAGFRAATGSLTMSQRGHFLSRECTLLNGAYRYC